MVYLRSSELDSITVVLSLGVVPLSGKQSNKEVDRKRRCEEVLAER